MISKERNTMERLSEKAEREIEKRRGGKNASFKYLRRDCGRDKETALRPAFVRDADKILNSAYYNRLSDKTQVLSFYRNDDITRRALHVQLVSRIARTVGSALSLDCNLIEAIALGHDIGHTPFGHAGEKILDGLLRERIGLGFNHNVQSVRVLDKIFEYNLTLETLDGILCHNGEMPSDSYRPAGIKDFADFDRRVDACMRDANYIKKLVPATKEGCLVRICDIIAYLGKDRQDYVNAGIGGESDFASDELAHSNSAIINNMCVNITENSLNKDGIILDKQHFELLKRLKDENYKVIYLTDKVRKYYDTTIAPMMKKLFERIVGDLTEQDENSIVYRHHIKFIDKKLAYKNGVKDYLAEPKELIAADFIASMTDDYFLAIYEELFGVRIKNYFD